MDGPNFYLATFQLSFVDPLGTCKCLPSRLVTNIGECGVYIDDFGETIFGFRIHNIYQFRDNEEAKCSCCQYRQFIDELKIRVNVLGSTPDGAPRPFPIDLKLPEDVGDEGNVEDCVTLQMNDGTKRVICAGHPGNPPLIDEAYFNNGCNYRITDNSGGNLSHWKRRLIRDGHLVNGQPYFVQIEYIARMRFQIIDTCRNGQVVLQDVVERHCRAKIDLTKI